MDKERRFAIKQAWIIDDDGNEIEIKSHSMDLIFPSVAEENKFRGGYGNTTYFSNPPNWRKINICKEIQPYKYTKRQ